MPPASAGVDISGSPIELVPSTSNFGPVLIVHISPSSPERYVFPPAMTGDALKPLPLCGIRWR